MDVTIKGYESEFRIADGRQGYLTEEEAHTLLVSTIQAASWFPKYQRCVENDPDEFKYMEQILDLEGNMLMFEHGDQRHRLMLDNAQVVPFDKKRNKYTSLRTTDGLQTVETPREIAYEQIEKFSGEYAGDITLLKWLVPFNDVYVHVFVKNFNVPPKQITFLADCDRRADNVSETYGVEKIHRISYDNIKPKGEQIEIMPKIMEQNDVLITNLPFAMPSDRGVDAGGQHGSGNSLWDQFLFDFLTKKYIKENGFFIAIHPPKWRKPDHHMYPIITGFNLRYLEMHNSTDGIELFDAGTPYDWYILQNCPPDDKPVTVKDINGRIVKVNLGQKSFLPNCDFELVEQLLARNDNERCNILYSRTEYGADRDTMQSTQDDQFKYPCIHSTPKKGVRYYYSSHRGSFFGVSKVIFGYSGFIQNVVIDMEGEYAMTDASMAIQVSSLEEAENLKRVLESTKFNEFLKNACRWSQFRIEWRLFRNLRQNFWKSFV